MANTGVDARKVQSEISRLLKEVPDVVETGLGVWAENLVSEMKQEGVVPRDTGRLRDSHGWDWIKGAVRAVRIFANTVYAAAVHETHETQGGWFRRVLAEQALPTLVKAVEAMKRKLGT